MSNLRTELKAELEAAGLLGYEPWRVYCKFALLLGITVALFAAFLTVPWALWYLKVPLFVCAVSVNIAVVMLGHESGHGAVSRTPWINDLLGYLTFPLMTGLSMAYWKYKHNTLHHSYPNVAQKDPDINPPFFALHKDQRATRAGFSRWVQHRQRILFWPLTLLTGVGMRRNSFLFHFTYGRRLVSWSARRIDLALMLLHYVLWLVVPPLLFGVPVIDVVLFYAAWTALVGLLLSAIFAPAHMTQPMYRDYNENFVLQLQTTQNLNTNWLFSYLLIGLDRQIEHHLFHRMSHLNIRAAQPIVRAFCARHGLPYREQGWGAALWAVTVRLKELPDYELVDRPPPITEPRERTAPPPVVPEPRWDVAAAP